MKKKSAIIIAIILMSIGFASISTTLILNGSAKVSENNEDFNVIFTAASIDGKDVYKTAVDETKKIITFTTSELKTLGQTSILTYEVTNNSSQYDAEVNVTCVPKTGTTAKYTSIKNKLDNDATKVLAKSSVNGTLTITLNKTATEEVSEEYTCKLEFNAVERNEIGVEKVYTEKLLNGTDPVLSNSLIPVTIADDGTVTYADTTMKWYSYEDKVWANAVILKDGVTHNVGEVIPESDIKQYYVWIPRYRYQLWNVDSNRNEGAEKAINIVFENKNTTVSNGTQNSEWLTHPAFTSFDTNGIWVGKFETSYDEETFTNSSLFLTKNPNTGVATNALNIIIKPNVRSLTNKVVSAFYTLGRGLNESLNSHMMKNMEWGATAYLTYSLYGKCTADGCEEVYINNINTGYLGSTSKFSGQWEYSASITGCSSSTATARVSSNQSSCASGYAYDGSNNKASTTGNISGIYDMSGGTWEYVMGVIEDVSGNPMSGRNNSYNSGFNGTYGCPTCDSQTATSKTNGISFPTDTRYYDLYVPNSSTLGDDTWYKYTNSKLEDAMKEVAISKTNSSSGDRGLWFSDCAYFPTATHPWVARGGGFYHGSGAGVFGFNRVGGNAHSYGGFRIVLAF